MAKVGDLKMRVIIGERSAMRPCKVLLEKEEQRALFHCFAQEAYVVPPSMVMEGAKGGQRTYEVALVELEDGKVIEISPTRVRFLDTRQIMNQCCFDEDWKSFIEGESK